MQGFMNCAPRSIVDLDRALKINPGDRTAAVLRKQMDAMAKSRAR